MDKEQQLISRFPCTEVCPHLKLSPLLSWPLDYNLGLDQGQKSTGSPNSSDYFDLLMFQRFSCILVSVGSILGNQGKQKVPKILDPEPSSWTLHFKGGK